MTIMYRTGSDYTGRLLVILTYGNNDDDQQQQHAAGARAASCMVGIPVATTVYEYPRNTPSTSTTTTTTPDVREMELRRLRVYSLRATARIR